MNLYFSIFSTEDIWFRYLEKPRHLRIYQRFTQEMCSKTEEKTAQSGKLNINNT